MVTRKCIEAYKASGLDGQLGIMIPDWDSVTFDDGTAYVAPNSETEHETLDRIERSKKAGRNLFREEWKPFVYEPNILY